MSSPGARRIGRREPALCATADPAVSAWPATTVWVKLAGYGVLPVNVELMIDSWYAVVTGGPVTL